MTNGNFCPPPLFFKNVINFIFYYLIRILNNLFRLHKHCNRKKSHKNNNNNNNYRFKKKKNRSKDLKVKERNKNFLMNNN